MANDGFDAGDPERTAEILHRMSDVQPEQVEAGPDSSPEAMAVLPAEGVDAWRAAGNREPER